MEDEVKKIHHVSNIVHSCQLKGHPGHVSLEFKDDETQDGNKLDGKQITCHVAHLPFFISFSLSPISPCAAYFTIFLNVAILNCDKFECQDMYNYAILPILFQTVISSILKKKVLITKNSPQPI